VFSQRVMLALTQSGLSREQAYGLVQRHALRCWEDGTPLMDALLNDREVRQTLSAQQITALFDLAPYLAQVDSIFERVGLRESSRPVKATPKLPVEKPQRGRGRSAKAEETPGLVRGKSGTVDAIVTGGAYQNISERPIDYMDSGELAAKRALDSYDAPDETLGEAAHQKKGVRGKGRTASTAARPRSRAAKPEAAPATLAPAPPEAEAAPKPARRRSAPKPAAEAAASLPTPVAEAAEGEGPKKRRRRGTRGGRRRKKGAEAAPETGA
jgi:hypothetical protein